MAEKTLTVAVMDAPYEAAASTTALRIVAAALARGVNVNVFAYEGAVALTMKDQAPHANPVKGTSVEEEQHPTTKDLVAALLALGQSEPKLTWVNCGLCVDERGAAKAILLRLVAVRLDMITEPAASTPNLEESIEPAAA